MTNADKNNIRSQFSRFQQSREKFYAPKFYAALQDQCNQYIQLIKAGHNPKNSLIHISSVPINKVMQPLYIEVGVTYAAKTRAYLPKVKSRAPIGFNQRMVDLINAYYQSDILNQSEDITETTRHEIEKILIEASAQSEDIDWITNAIEDLGGINRTRSRLIARTETVTAANQGAMFGAKESGLKLNKEWLAVNDNRTRESHRNENGIVIPVDDYFNVNGSPMQQPGDRGGVVATPPEEICNCRCTVAFIPVRDGSGRLVRI